MEPIAEISGSAEEHLIGTWRRFGPTGPVYEVISVGPDGADRTMRIRVVETGEQVDYRLAALLDDPRAD